MTTLAPAPGFCRVCVTGVVPHDSLWCLSCGNGPLTTTIPEGVRASLISRPLLVACRNCGMQFHSTKGQGLAKVYCNKKCRQQATWKRYRESHPKKFLTPAERSERARKAVKARWDKVA